jgi:hypothetical protein
VVEAPDVDLLVAQWQSLEFTSAVYGAGDGMSIRVPMHFAISPHPLKFFTPSHLHAMILE